MKKFTCIFAMFFLFCGAVEAQTIVFMAEGSTYMNGSNPMDPKPYSAPEGEVATWPRAYEHTQKTLDEGAKSKGKKICEQKNPTKECTVANITNTNGPSVTTVGQGSEKPAKAFQGKSAKCVCKETKKSMARYRNMMGDIGEEIASIIFGITP